MTEKQINVIRNNLVRYCDFLLNQGDIDRLNKLTSWEARTLIRLIVTYRLEEAIAFMTERKVLSGVPTILSNKKSELKSRRAWAKKKWAKKMEAEGKAKGTGKVVVVVKEVPVPAEQKLIPEQELIPEPTPEPAPTPTPTPEPQPVMETRVIQVSTPQTKEEMDVDQWEEAMLKELNLI